MAKYSAGILVYRKKGQTPEVFLAHPGGPFWAKKDTAGWSIPKGEFDPQTEDGLTAAKREFQEEIGRQIDGDFEYLGQLKQSGGKIIYVWTVEGDIDPENIESNRFEMEWPKGSPMMREFPEVDRAGWFDIAAARNKLHKGQRPFIDMLTDKLK